MALLRTSAAGSAPTPPPPPESSERLLDLLVHGDGSERRHAARALSRDPAVTLILAARLEEEPMADVRDALFDSLVTIGGIQTAGLIAGLLRSADASVRGGAVEALKQLRDDAVPVLDALLDDLDSDTRLLAVEVTRTWPSSLAVPRLRHVIENDPHVNVCGAAVDVATEVGTSELLPALASLRGRFANEQFLVFAVDVACSRIHAAGDTGA